MLDPQSDLVQLAEYRLILGVRIAALLEKNNCHKNFHDIAFFIFNTSHHTRPNEYLFTLTEWFNASEDQLDTVIALVEDAWNYFPHRSLNGKCPAELIAAGGVAQ